VNWCNEFAPFSGLAAVQSEADGGPYNGIEQAQILPAQSD